MQGGSFRACSYVTLSVGIILFMTGILLVTIRRGDWQTFASSPAWVQTCSSCLQPNGLWRQEPRQL